MKRTVMTRKHRKYMWDVRSSTYSTDASSTLKAVIERASVLSDTNPRMFRH